VTLPITITFDEQASDFLRGLTALSGKDSVGDVVAAAVRLYEYLLIQQKAGNVAYVKSGAGTLELDLLK